MALPTPVVVESLTTLDFRNLADATVELGPRLTVVHGANGAGKTNLLEAVYFALLGCSCRTSRSRDLIRFEKPLARAEAAIAGDGERWRFLAAVSHAEGRRQLVDGVEPRAQQVDARPAVAVFMPDRLALIKGPPSTRRAHLDRLIAALWPGRRGARASFRRVLAQRNALLVRVRAGHSPPDALDAWDLEFAGAAMELTDARAEACALLATPFADECDALGLPGEARIGYRPRGETSDVEQLAAELRERRSQDIERGFTTRGPHLDEIDLTLGARSLRRFGSQGQQRTALLSLLFAERELLLELRGKPPLMLLDDVMSELDPAHRELLLERLSLRGQTLLTATHLGQLPDCDRSELPLAAGRASPGPSKDLDGGTAALAA